MRRTIAEDQRGTNAKLKEPQEQFRAKVGNAINIEAALNAWPQQSRQVSSFTPQDHGAFESP